MGDDYDAQLHKYLSIKKSQSLVSQINDPYYIITLFSTFIGYGKKLKYLMLTTNNAVLIWFIFLQLFIPKRS